MVTSCYVCKQECYPNCGLSFHRFPRDMTMRTMWINALPHTTRRVTHTAMVCSRHFKKEDYEMKQWKRVLRKDAVPSLNFTNTRGYRLGENTDSVIYFGTLSVPPQEDDGSSASPRLSKSDEVASVHNSDNDSETQELEYLEDSVSSYRPSDSSSEDDQNEDPTKNTPLKSVIKENATSNEEVKQNEAFTQALARIDRIADGLSKKKDDEFDGFGKYIATTLRALPTKMAIIATKKIHETLTDIQLKSVPYQRRKMDKR